MEAMWRQYGVAMNPHERPSWKVRANYWTGWRAVGGWLSLGDGDLVFRPHALDRALGGRGFRTSLRDIVSIEVERRGAVVRRRMFVRTGDGIESAFLVPRVDERAEDIRRMIAEGAGA